MLYELANWLATTHFSHVVADNAWVVPAFQSVHIMAIGVTFASMAMLDLRLIGVIGRHHSIESLAHRFLPWMWGALTVLLVTGIVMIMGEPPRALLNWVFQLKMTMLALVIAITLVFGRVLRAYSVHWDRSPSPSVATRAVGLISLVLWVAIIVAGRWIAYTE